MSTTKLDDRHAIRGDILDLHTIDGRPIRVVYPLWGSIYQTSYKTICDEYMNGKNNSGKYCFNQIKNILNAAFKPLANEPNKTRADELLVQKYKTILHGLLPISPYAQSKFPRELYAYGIYGAMSCGMQLDFKRITERCQFVANNLHSSDPDVKRQVMNTMNKLTLEIRQMNYIGCMLTAPANISATSVNIVRALTMDSKELSQLPESSREIAVALKNEFKSKIKNPNVLSTLQNLNQSQFKELLNYIDKLTVNATNNISGHVSNATSAIARGDLYKPLDDNSIKEATLEDVVENMINSLNKLPSRVTASTLIDTIKTSTLQSFNELEQTIERDVIHTADADKITEDYMERGISPANMSEDKIGEIIDENEANNNNQSTM